MTFKPAIPEDFRPATPEELERAARIADDQTLAMFETDGLVSAVYNVGLFDSLKAPADMARDYGLGGITIQSRNVEKIGGVECGVLNGISSNGFEVLAILCPSNRVVAQFILTVHPDLSSELVPKFRSAVARSEGLTPYRTDGRKEQGSVGLLFLLVAIGGLLGRWLKRQLLR